MLDWTDKHCRYFHRILTKQTLLYTEMVTTGAILFGKGNYLDFNVDEHPIALQLGGSDPNALAQCAKLAQNHGYDEVNLNVGCPSDRVQNGMFGACLMGNADLVAKCVASMQERIDIFIYEIEETEMYLLVLRINANPIKATVTIISQQVFKDHLSGISSLELFDKTVKLCNVFTRIIVFLKKLYYV